MGARATGLPGRCNASVARIEGDPCRPTEGGAFFGIRSADRGAALRGLVFWRLNRVFMRSTRTSRKVQAILESIPKSNPTTMLSENPICQVEGNVERGCCSKTISAIGVKPARIDALSAHAPFVSEICVLLSIKILKQCRRAIPLQFGAFYRDRSPHQRIEHSDDRLLRESRRSSQSSWD